MKNMLKSIICAVLAIFALSACGKWTETESIRLTYETLESKNPELWARYLKSLREYHASAHQVLIAKFDNKAEFPSGRGDHINCLPDSVDFVILNNSASVSEAIKTEMAEIRETKGIRTLVNVSYDAILSVYKGELAGEAEAKEAEWNALSEEEQERRKEEFDADTRGVDSAERFAGYVAGKAAALFDQADGIGVDGVNVIFNGANPASFDEEKKADALMRQQAFFDKVNGWMASHAGALVFFEGTPRYILAETGVLDAAKFIIIPALSATNTATLSYIVAKAIGGAVPADRIVIGVTAVDITDPTNTNGNFGDISAIEGAASWAVKEVPAYTKKGVCVDHAQFDYYNIANVYSQINKAISIMNPSPVK